MKVVTVGERRYRMIAVQRAGGWVARAERIDSGEPFGIECAGRNEAEAIDRLASWLDWQHEHACALASLQQAERVYHRTIAGSAFAAVEGPTPSEIQKEAVEAVETARVHLDDVRARRPE
jgi:hypothetical protein